MKCGFFENFLMRAWAIHAAGDKWAGRGDPALPGGISEVGNWIREHRGIYRLRQFPLTEGGYLVLWSLWSRDRSGFMKF